jgi:hypothetical protein
VNRKKIRSFALVSKNSDQWALNGVKEEKKAYLNTITEAMAGNVEKAQQLEESMWSWN